MRGTADWALGDIGLPGRVGGPIGLGRTEGVWIWARVRNGTRGTFGMSVAWICVELRPAEESSACCGVNLAGERKRQGQRGLWGRELGQPLAPRGKGAAALLTAFYPAKLVQEDGR